MDACIHAAKLNASTGCRQIFPVFDAGSISASKVFQVSATIVAKQKLYSHKCRQTECKYWMQYCPWVLDAASFPTFKVLQEDNTTQVGIK